MRTFLILAGVGLVALLLVIRLFFSQMNGQNEEREWFIKNLGYEFSVKVDSVQGNHRVFIDGRIIAGNPRLYREDSLKNSLEKYGNLGLVIRHQNDSITFALQEFPDKVMKGDSIRFSSRQNAVLVFRSGKQVITAKMSDALFGWGRPPFRTK